MFLFISLNKYIVKWFYDYLSDSDKAFFLANHERIIDCRPVVSVDDLSSLICHKEIFKVYAIDWVHGSPLS